MSTLNCHGPETNKKQVRTISRFREVLPQVLAMTAANCVVMDMAVTFFFSTLVIDDLHGAEGDLSMDDTQASWFGGLPYLCQPIGSIGSGFLVAWLGRKRSLMLICVPYLVCCVLMSTAPSLAVLLFTNVIIGITVGFTEAPINSYFGEICQPELRSILAGCAALFYQLGMFLQFLLGSLMHWRKTAAVSCVFPIVTFIFLSQVVESPIWLVAQGRKKDAERALCWLRGWVDPSAVQQELEDLVNYHKTVTLKSDISRKCEETSSTEETQIGPEYVKFLEAGTLIQNGDNAAKHKESNDGNKQWDSETEYQFPNRTEMTENGGNVSGIRKIAAKMRLLMEPETRRPLVLIVLVFSFSGMSGMFSIKPFMMEVMRRFYSPIDAKWTSVILAAAGFLGSVILIIVVSFIGKRRLGLWSTAMCLISCLLLGLYAFLVIKPTNETGDDSYVVITWAPLLLFILLSFAATIQGQLPWLLVAEAFPFRTRGTASGLAAGTQYLMAFVASKTYLAMEHTLQLYGTFWVFAGINCLCLLYLYFKLPETEGKSLEEIERLFADKKK